MPGFAVIIPAAGGSSRLGHPKQLVLFEGEPLVRRAARTALESGAAHVIVVVGAFSGEVCEAVNDLAVDIVANKRWHLGLGHSIARGVCALPLDVDAVVLTLCDVPTVTPALLSELASAVKDGNPPVAAAEYDCHLGPPCAFHASQFPLLRELTGDKGARAILEASPNVARIDFPEGVCDVDTPEDVLRLKHLSRP
ncbi:MAG: nucleotidyltransferase family protein [Fimbriimonadaceae bacterium]